MRVILEAFGRLRSKPLDLREPGPTGKIEYMWHIPDTLRSLTMTKIDQTSVKAHLWRCSFEHSGRSDYVDGLDCEIWTLTDIKER